MENYFPTNHHDISNNSLLTPKSFDGSSTPFLFFCLLFVGVVGKLGEVEEEVTGGEGCGGMSCVFSLLLPG